eukprot:501995-Karenia_brevis.AAC.1
MALISVGCNPPLGLDTDLLSGLLCGGLLSLGSRALSILSLTCSGGDVALLGALLISAGGLGG